MLSRLRVIGAGSWGTALAIALAPRFRAVHLWCHNHERAKEISALRQNVRYLPGFQIPDHVTVSSCLTASLHEADLVLLVVPSTFFRGTLENIRPHLARSSKLVSATKGIEETTFCRMSQVAASVLAPDGLRPVAVLSGPSFAREVAAGEPAALVIASEDLSLAATLQQAMSTPHLRFYTTRDVAGVEIGAALKNVIAIGAGICNGLGLGSNSVAALITRGLAEIMRLAVRLGGTAATLSGLAGLGDLVLTATGDLSRNRSVGVQLGVGERLESILARMNMVAEG